MSKTYILLPEHLFNELPNLSDHDFNKAREACDGDFKIFAQMLIGSYRQKLYAKLNIKYYKFKDCDGKYSLRENLLIKDIKEFED